VLLFDAVRNYGRNVGEASPEMVKYFNWFLARHPDILDSADIPDEVRQQLKMLAKMVSKEGREAFKGVRSGPIKIPR
jgi:hypothetical protein